MKPKTATLVTTFFIFVMLFSLNLPSLAQGSAAQEPGLSQSPDQPAELEQSTVNQFGRDFLVSGVVQSGEEHPYTSIYTGLSTVAYNDDDDQFLVVWTDDRDRHLVSSQFDDYTQVYGQLYTAQGIPLGENFPITDEPADHLGVSVAYNTTSGGYLVVFETGYGTEADIAGQRLDSSGALVGANFAISNPSDGQWEPVVAYNLPRDEFLVAWMDRRNGTSGWDIYGQQVDADGDLLDNPHTVASETSPDINFAITLDPLDQEYPALAYDSAADEYLLIWMDYRNEGTSSVDVYGQRLSSSCELLDNPDTIPDESQLSVNFPISLRPGGQFSPKLAVNDDLNEYLVVWNDENPGNADWGIYGQRVDADGELIDDPQTGNDESDPTVGYFITAPEAQGGVQVHLAYNSDDQEFLVVWQDQRNLTTTGLDVYGIRISFAAGFDFSAQFAIFKNTWNDAVPRAAYSSGSHLYLVVGYSGSATYGQRLFWSGQLLGAAFTIPAAEGDQGPPVVVYNPQEFEYLVAWTDHFPLTSPSTYGLFIQRYDYEGKPLGESCEIAWDEAVISSPAVAYNSDGNSYLFAYENPPGELMGLIVPHDQLCEVISPFRIGRSSPSGASAAIAYNPDVNFDEFLVVYLDRDSSGSNSLRGRRISDEGAIDDAGITFAYGAKEYKSPDLVYNTTQQEFLVVWTDPYYDDFGDIYAARLGRASDEPLPWFTITTAADAQSEPALVWNDEIDQYLVVWQDYRSSGTSGSDIYGQLLNGYLAAKSGDNFQVSTSTALDFQNRPDVAYINSVNRYRVVWQDNREAALGETEQGYNLRAQWVSTAGALMSPFDNPIFRYPGDQTNPVLAYGPGYERALTVWLDKRNGDFSDIYGRFGALDITPPTAAFNLSPSVGYEDRQYIVNAWPSEDEQTPKGMLMVRWDFTSDGSWDTSFSFDKYFTIVIPNPGTFNVTMEVRDSAGLTATVTHPVEVLPETGGMPATGSMPDSIDMPGNGLTANLSVDPIIASAGTTFNFDGSASSGPGNIFARWDWQDDGVWDTVFESSLTAAHLYTAAGDYTIRMEVRGASGPTAADVVEITVQAGDPVSLQVVPYRVRVPVNRSFQFGATASDLFGNRMYHPLVLWTLLDPDAGQIDAVGLFTAGLNAGGYPDVVRVESNGLTDLASVRVFWPWHRFLPVIFKK